MADRVSDPIAKHNRRAWDLEVEKGNPASRPVSADQIADARNGILRISLTGNKPLPADWLAHVAGQDVLCLACGGGQQVPLLAAAGARVTSFENSSRQLALDVQVASAEGLAMTPVLGDMQDLQALGSGAFDRIVLGLGAQFIRDVSDLWPQFRRVLRRHGSFVGAFCSPFSYTLDWLRYKAGELVVAHPLPYSDLESLTASERAVRFADGDPLEFGHALEEILGGMTAAGFSINGFFEDVATGELSARYFATYFVVRADLDRD